MKPTKPKINPGKGWRLLRGNEIVKEGDWYLNKCEGTWSRAKASVLRPVKLVIKHIPEIIAYRRRTTRK